jgi:hypothetical protein
MATLVRFVEFKSASSVYVLSRTTVPPLLYSCNAVLTACTVSEVPPATLQVDTTAKSRYWARMEKMGRKERGCIFAELWFCYWGIQKFILTKPSFWFGAVSFYALPSFDQYTKFKQWGKERIPRRWTIGFVPNWLIRWGDWACLVVFASLSFVWLSIC